MSSRIPPWSVELVGRRDFGAFPKRIGSPMRTRTGPTPISFAPFGSELAEPIHVDGDDGYALGERENDTP
jgi:hypothetical protein